MAGQGVYELDLLLGAGLVKALDHTYIGMEVYGISNCLRREVESGRVEHCVEWSNAAIAWRFKATAMGVPFLPTRSMLGTDTLKYSAAKVVEDPFGGEPIALLPALILDVGLIHVHRADKYGNCQIDGISGFAFELARASKRLLISTEKIVPTEEIRKKPDQTIIPYYLIFLTQHFVGLQGAPRRYYSFASYEYLASIAAPNRIMSIVAIALIVGQVIALVNFFWSAFRGRPAEANRATMTMSTR